MKPISAILFMLSLVVINACVRSTDYESLSGNLNPEPTEEPKSPEELRMELKAQEELSPLEYISDENVHFSPQQIQTRSAGFFHDAEYEPDGAIISGKFNNSATLARFKDVKLRIRFYSQTSTLIDEQTYVVYEYVEPHSSTSFSFKIHDYPEAMESFAAEVVGATAVSDF